MIVASCLLTLAVLGQLFGYWFALPEHIGDRSWPAHARFHVIQAFFWISGLDIVTLVLVWGPLRSQERWAFWALLFLFVSSQASYFFAVLLLPEGRPHSRRNWYDWTLGAVLLIFVLGLFWAAQSTGIL